MQNLGSWNVRQFACAEKNTTFDSYAAEHFLKSVIWRFFKIDESLGRLKARSDIF